MKKLIIVLLAIVTIAAFAVAPSSPAAAKKAPPPSVAGTTWYVVTDGATKVKGSGDLAGLYGLAGQQRYWFQFNPDHTLWFGTEDDFLNGTGWVEYAGTWEQKKGRIKLVPNLAEIAEILRETYSGEGRSVVSVKVRTSWTGKMKWDEAGLEMRVVSKETAKIKTLAGKATLKATQKGFAVPVE